MLYIEELLDDIILFRLVVEALIMRDSMLELGGPSLGNGNSLSRWFESFSLEIVICFDFKNNFIFNFSSFCLREVGVSSSNSGSSSTGEANTELFREARFAAVAGAMNRSLTVLF
jgi:hypothetical protein